MCKICDDAAARGQPRPSHLHQNEAAAATASAAPESLASPPRRQFFKTSAAVAGVAVSLLTQEADEAAQRRAGEAMRKLANRLSERLGASRKA